MEYARSHTAAPAPTSSSKVPFALSREFDTPAGRVSIRVTAKGKPSAPFNLGLHGDETDPQALLNRKHLSLELGGLPLVDAHQVHGVTIADVVSSDPHTLPRCDGLTTSLTSLPILVLTADCYPLVLWRDDGRVAVLHAGRKGIYGDILGELVRRWPGRWQMLVGPGISAENYEVGPGFASYRNATAFGDRIHLDLLSEIRRQATEVGVEIVEEAGRCTFADPDLFSYRQNGPGAGRFATVVWRTAYSTH